MLPDADISQFSEGSADGDTVTDPEPRASPVEHATHDAKESVRGDVEAWLPNAGGKGATVVSRAVRMLGKRWGIWPGNYAETADLGESSGGLCSKGISSVADGSRRCWQS